MGAVDRYPEAKDALLKATRLFSAKRPPSSEDARLDAAVPWSGLPRGFFFAVVNLAIAQFEVGEEDAARKRVVDLLKAMGDKPLPAALATQALMLQAAKGGSNAV